MDIQKLGIDRRRFDRFLVDYPVSYNLKSSTVISTGIAMNLSEGGLLAYFFDRINIGSELDLEMFYTSEFQFTSLIVEARIVWKDIIETSEAIEYQYGIEFIRMDREKRTRLHELLASKNPTRSHHCTENAFLQKKTP